jgi:shikimate kinase
MTAAGKTTIGRQLAEDYGLPFFDSDNEIAKSANRPCAEIITTYGEAYFRRLEEHVILSLLDGRPMVLALGGGAWMHDRVRLRVHEIGLSVWLQVDQQLIVRRAMAEGRLIARDPDGADRVAALLATRSVVYAEATLHVPLADQPVRDAVLRVVRAIQEHHG